MSLWTSKQLSSALGVSVSWRIAGKGVSIDTRTLKKGDVFIALQGPTHDGHAFVTQAIEKGAAAVVVHKPVPEAGRKQILVDDTTKALEALGRARRKAYQGTVIGLTGSLGKTTTKEMLRLALSAYGTTFATEGNLNNHYGVPLTLARLPLKTTYAVIEMGMNHAGEIAALAKLAQPDVALITTVAAVHIENFNSVLEIAHAKAEIFQGLGTDGIAVYPSDNLYSDELDELAPAHRLLFKKSDLSKAQQLPHGVRAQYLSHTLDIPVQGLLYLENALAAVTVLQALGLPIAPGVRALSQFTPAPGRGQLLTLPWQDGTVTLLDHSYNANPQAMLATLEALVTFPKSPTGRFVAILGDMLELGDRSAKAHRDILAAVAGLPVDLCYTVGPQFQAVRPEAGVGESVATWQELLPRLQETLQTGDVILVKGSAGLKLGQLVQHLRTPPA